MIRAPTDAEYAAYLGEHCFHIWRRCGPAWVCPGCNRSRRQIMRWTRRNPRPHAGIHTTYMGWMAGLHTHHDHAADREGFYRPEFARFPEAIICDQCNSADGRAKRKLQLPRGFSFSPDEIRRFVTPTPHAPHKLRLGIALHLFKATLASTREGLKIGGAACLN